MAIPASHIALKMDDEAIADDHLYDMRVPIFSFGSFFSRELCLRSMNRTLSRYNKCLDSSETALVEHEEEELLEAANALKKQMWAEVQLDKRRMKEEYVMKMQYPSYISDKTEPNVQISSAEGRQSPLPTVDDKNGLVSTNPVEQKEHLHDAQNDQNYPIHMPTERNPPIQEASTCTDNLSLLQPGYAAERSRSQLKAYIGHKAEEMYVYRSLPLGQDRRRNRYWQFITSSSRNDPGSGRIFVKLRHGCWRLIDSEEGNSDIDQLGKIFAAFGTPKPSQWPDIKYLPDYVEYQYVPGQPLRQLFPMASADALDLLSKMFTYDPKARISALQALEHRTSWCSLNSI